MCSKLAAIPFLCLFLFHPHESPPGQHELLWFSREGNGSENGTCWRETVECEGEGLVKALSVSEGVGSLPPLSTSVASAWTKSFGS